MTIRSPGFFGTCFLVTISVAWAQPSSDQKDFPPANEALEEIVVYGEKSLTRLRFEVYMAEDEFFSVFNELNSTDEFDVECDFVVDLGSYRRRHLCMPKFAEREEYMATQVMLLGGHWSDFRVHESRVRKKEERMWHEIAELVSSNPEMQTAMNRLADANRAVEIEVRKRKLARSEKE